MLKSLLGHTIALALVAPAMADEFCSRFSDQMSSDKLYAATCVGRSGCTLEEIARDLNGGANIVDRNGLLRPFVRGASYRLLFKTGIGDQRNSLVVVQLKRTNVAPEGELKAPAVKLRRAGFDFACVKSRRDTTLADWPINSEVQEIPYEKYDHFHRYGVTTDPENKALSRINGFHVLYNNGKTCVSTLDSVRARQFLLEDRDNVPNFFGAIFSQVTGFLDATPASAQQATKYDEFRVFVSNYQRKQDEAGCFSFPLQAGTTTSAKIEINLRDLEEQSQSYPIDRSRTWILKLSSKARRSTTDE